MSVERAHPGVVGTKRWILRNSREKRFLGQLAPYRVGETIEYIVGCKWSLTIMHVIDSGMRRPGAIERSIDGLSAKVLGDCLKRLVQMKILDKQSFPEVPPRVEYDFTSTGKVFYQALAHLRAIESLLRESQNDIELR